MLNSFAFSASIAGAIALAAVSATAMEDYQMKRTSINPVSWGASYTMDQGEVTEGASRVLRTSGQVAFKDDPESEFGVAITNAGNLRGQIEDALANIDAVLQEAGMGREDIVHIHFFTTDVDGFLENYDVYMGWIDPAGIRPPQSLLGVSRLVFPDLLVEIEVTAAK